MLACADVPKNTQSTVSVKPSSVEAVNVKFALKVVISMNPSLTCNHGKLNIGSKWREAVLSELRRRRRWEVRGGRVAKGAKAAKVAKVARAAKAERPHVPVLLTARARWSRPARGWSGVGALFRPRPIITPPARKLWISGQRRSASGYW